MLLNKRGLDWVKTRHLVVMLSFETPVLTGKLQYIGKSMVYLVRDKIRPHHCKKFAFSKLLMFFSIFVVFSYCFASLIYFTILGL